MTDKEKQKLARREEAMNYIKKLEKEKERKRNKLYKMTLKEVQQKVSQEQERSRKRSMLAFRDQKYQLMA